MYNRRKAPESFRITSIFGWIYEVADPPNVGSFIMVEPIPTMIGIIAKVGSCPSAGGTRSALADIISRVSDCVFVRKQTVGPREIGDTFSRI